MYEKDIILYILKECDGLHPFHVSRIIALLDIVYLKERGKKLTDFDYQKMEYGFYSHKIPETLNGLPVEKVKEEGRSYLRITEENVKVNLPEEVRKKINKILDEICDLSDYEINIKVISSPYYRDL